MRHKLRLDRLGRASMVLLPCLALAGCGDPAPPTAPPQEARGPAAAPASAPTPAPAPAPSPMPSPTPGGESSYTALTDCRLIESAPDEAGYYLRRCPGKAGYTLDVTEADGRFNITLVSAAGREPLEMPGIIGTGFNELGNTAEWRAPSPGAEPTALIVRYAVVEKAEQPDRPTSYLVVVDLARRCISGKVPPGADQGTAARRIADEGRAACLPGPGGTRGGER